MTRQTKTPRQRAEEQLGVADRVVRRLAKTKTRLTAELKATTDEYDAAVARRDHLKKHPDLEKHPTTTPAGGTTT
jgi:hypothetical protein